MPDFTITRILVTGGAGFIGSAVLHYLHAQTQATLIGTCFLAARAAGGENGDITSEY